MPSIRQLWQVLWLTSIVVVAYVELSWGQVSRESALRSTVVKSVAEVVLQNNRLTVDIHNKDLQQLLESIALQGHIDLRHLDGLPPKLISIRFSNVPLLEGLKRLFRMAEIESYVLVTESTGESTRVQRILFFPSSTVSGRSPVRHKTVQARSARSTLRPRENQKEKRERPDDSGADSVFDDIKVNTAARRLLSQLVHPNEQVRERALERLVLLVESDDKQAELLEVIEPLMEDLSSEDLVARNEARQEIRKLLRR